jgi:MFS family permease
MKDGLLVQSASGHVQEKKAPLRLYPQRFWLAFVFCCCASFTMHALISPAIAPADISPACLRCTGGLVQSAMWNCYSPISQPIKQVYGWSDALIGAQANTAGIAFAVTIAFWAWLLDTRGARLSVVCGCVLLSICGLLRCLPVPKHWHGTVVLVSMVFNGISAPPIALAPPILSASWFATNERTTATAVMTTFNYLGQALGFILGPAMVPESVKISVEETHKNIISLYWLEAGLQVAITLAVILCVLLQPLAPPPTLTDTAARAHSYLPATLFSPGH